MTSKSLKSSSDSDDDSSVYTDDFDTDSRVSTPDHKLNNKSHPADKKSHASLNLGTRTTQTKKADNGQNASAKKPYSSPLKHAVSKPSKHLTAISKSTKKTSAAIKPDLVQTRMLSAQRSRINILNNELGELHNKLEEIIKENRLLKKLQYRQEKSLEKFVNKDGEIPRLISQYEDDQRVLKTRLRKSQEAERILDSKLRETNDELMKAEISLQRYKKLVDDKNLAERSDLTKQLNTAQDRLYDLEKRNSELDKKLELTTHSFSRQINNEKTKHAETREKLKSLEQKCNFLENRLKEKERALQVNNIYSMRSKSSPEKVPVEANRLSGRKSSKKNNEKDKHLKTNSPCQSPRKMDEVEKRLSGDSDADEKKTEKFEVGSKIESVELPQSSTVQRDETTLESMMTKEINNGSEGFPINNVSLPAAGNDENPLSFLTSGKSASSTFVSDFKPSSNSSSENKKETATLLREKSFTIESKSMKRSNSDEEKKIEEEKKKAALLAKLQNFEGHKEKSSNTADEIKKLLTNSVTASQKPFPRLFKNRNSTFEAGDNESLSSNKQQPSKYQASDESEIMFGGYAPTVTSAPKRKLRSNLIQTPPSNDSDEPLFDLSYGKSKNNSNFLHQLFGSDLSSNSDSDVGRKENTPSRKLSISKSASRILTQNGYPWQNELQSGKDGNAQLTKDSLGDGTLLKSVLHAVDDDIQEIVL